MPAAKKRQLVELLNARGIPLIEDDIYGSLAFGPTRPGVAKAFDPRGMVLLCGSLSKTLALSEPVYGHPTIAAVGVACHEAGHALQHAAGYAPLKVRSLLVKPAGFGSQLGFYVMFAGLAFQSAGMFQIGAILFSAFVLFTLVTLPVEFDASSRAKRLAVEQGILSPQELAGMSRVLDAAALTYVAAAASSILTLLYFLMRAGVLGSQRD